MISQELYQKLSKILIHYSLNVQAEDLVWLQGDVSGLPLLSCLYKQLIDCGAFVESNISANSWTEYLGRYGTDEQLLFSSPSDQLLSEKCNKMIRILSTTNTQMLHGLPSSRLALLNQRRKKVLSTMMERSASNTLDWVLSMMPCSAYAQEAQMGLEAFEELFYKACFLDAPDPIEKWKELSSQHEAMIKFLETKTELVIKSSEVELAINIENMKWKNSCGKRNFPDGEVFTGPNLKSSCGGINGYARFPFPTMFSGIVIEDISLKFEQGRVVFASAKTNQDLLLAMLDTDKGARYVGEIAIGTNNALKQVTKNILLDEKIGKTFHIALGAGYPETGNTNTSSLHWDLIGDLRQGRMFADDICFYNDGQFLFDGWPKL
ncbi:thermophilic metalloprotease family protein [Chlamydia ibidis]|uniref:Thermophilic metalloprotease family protein n=2 Tax=Chlamydia ibidis TaxID=1405396 RepID=S7KIT0_9CHLA|nr:aminopeptidase [Chlamydia ibidis]EPP34300.1 thermophilic metalloprotease family protein [Chlamydia ibidis]EQM62643.1 thermophilic metalloprotease family protein [Chlamydia ibidis 10-1398/6]